jgi:hypothetical protein
MHRARSVLPQDGVMRLWHNRVHGAGCLRGLFFGWEGKRGFFPPETWRFFHPSGPACCLVVVRSLLKCESTSKMLGKAWMSCACKDVMLVAVAPALVSCQTREDFLMDPTNEVFDTVEGLLSPAPTAGAAVGATNLGAQDATSTTAVEAPPAVPDARPADGNPPASAPLAPPKPAGSGPPRPPSVAPAWKPTGVQPSASQSLPIRPPTQLGVPRSMAPPGAAMVRPGGPATAALSPHAAMMQLKAQGKSLGHWQEWVRNTPSSAYHPALPPPPVIDTAALRRLAAATETGRYEAFTSTASELTTTHLRDIAYLAETSGDWKPVRGRATSAEENKKAAERSLAEFKAQVRMVLPATAGKRDDGSGPSQVSDRLTMSPLCPCYCCSWDEHQSVSRCHLTVTLTMEP